MARSEQSREKFLEILAAMPFISHACKKAGVGKATIYRWMKSNPRFKQKVEKALSSGRENLVDMAEATLVNKIRDKDLGAIKFFLMHNSKRYAPKEKLARPIAHMPQFADRAQSDEHGESVRIFNEEVTARAEAYWKKQAAENDRRRQMERGSTTPEKPSHPDASPEEP